MARHLNRLSGPLLLALACGSASPEVPHCVAGETSTCACAGGTTSTQTCNAQGTFEACACPSCKPGGLVPCTCDGAPGVALCSGDGQPGACQCSEDVDAGAGMDAGAKEDAPADTGAADTGMTMDTSSPTGFVTLDLPARHIVWDGARRRLYASIPGKHPSYGNSLAVIDPESMSVVKSVAVGSEPNALAISDDASTLWVGLDGSSALRKVDLTTDPPTPGAMSPLPPDMYGLYVDQLFVVGDTTTQVMAAVKDARHHNGHGVLFFDDGKPRKYGANTSDCSLTRGPDGWAFAYHSTGSHFFTIRVDDDGLMALETIIGFGTGVGELRWSADDGRVYSSSGDVVSVDDLLAPVSAGSFGSWGAVLPEVSAGRVVIVSPKRSDPLTVRHFDPVTFAEKAKREFTIAMAPLTWDLVRVGERQLAMMMTDSIGSVPGPNRILFLEEP